MPAMMTVYHKTDGATQMYEIDARYAVGTHRQEWSFNPWPESEKKDEAPAGNPASEAQVDIPDKWSDLPAAERIALARKLGATGNLSAAKADEFIEAYGAANTPKPDDQA